VRSESCEAVNVSGHVLDARYPMRIPEVKLPGHVLAFELSQNKLQISDDAFGLNKNLTRQSRIPMRRVRTQSSEVMDD
jgi:hypothetical protein